MVNILTPEFIDPACKKEMTLFNSSDVRDIFACALKKHIAQRTCVHRCSCLVELPNQVELDISLSSKNGWSYREEWLPQAVLTHTGAPRPIALSQKRLGFRSIALDQLVETERKWRRDFFVDLLLAWSFDQLLVTERECVRDDFVCLLGKLSICSAPQWHINK